MELINPGKSDTIVFNSLETGGGETSVTSVGSSSTFSFILFPLETLLQGP